MGQIIASGNLKGGTGKTTIAVNLACALATRGLEVVLFDVDPQASAREWARSGLLPIRVEAAPPINPTGGGRWLARATELASPVDALVIDLPPLIVPAIASVMMIADLVVVPITPSAVDVGPTEQVLRMIRITRESRRDGGPKALLVPNRTDPGGTYHEATQAAVGNLHERWAPPVRHHIDHVDAFALGSWTGRYAPDSIATADILALADAVEQALGIAPGPRSKAEPARRDGARLVPVAAGLTPP
ncbi:MAG TPA: ParA family protein [Geminicoccaceae bacterium]|nr:ParA family protein [Geminicoccaceae bacterium]